MKPSIDFDGTDKCLSIGCVLVAFLKEDRRPFMGWDRLLTKDEIKKTQEYFDDLYGPGEVKLKKITPNK